MIILYSIQRELPTSGVEGDPGIILIHDGKQIKIKFRCPISGDNYFDVENELSEVAVSVDWGPGTPGHPVNGTVTIRNAKAD